MSDSLNPRLDLLYQAAERFDFIVDTRGIYPTMIKGQKAAQYTTHRDMLRFISVTFIDQSGREVTK